MFRRPRQTEPDELSTRLSKSLQSLNMIPWGALAMSYLGVPIVVGVMSTLNIRFRFWLLLTIFLSL